jgi:Signal transduction histidine kinase
LLRDITRLREVDRLKSEFIMAASHELRTPLTGLQMSIGLLMEHLDPGLSENDRELLIAAHEETLRMKALVNDLLDLSKIESGKIDLEFEELSVQPLLASIETIFKNQLEIRNVHLSVDSPEKLSNVRADSNKVVWVLSNLVSNSLRYVPDGGHIWLTARQSGTFVHLSVRDDGPGIPVEYQSRLFQKFVKVKGRESGGSGLGLAICKEIVRAHGGSIWVESQPGKGCTFTFTLPVAAS